MIKTEYFGYYTLQPWEFIMLPLLLILIYVVSAIIKNRHIEKEPYYKYYIPGVMAKVFGGIALCLIYVYHYKGGDTLMYFESSWAMANLFWERPSDFFTVLFGENSMQNLMLFDNGTGYPYIYLYSDPRTFLVIRIVSPLMVIAQKSYLLTTVLLAWVTYSGVWRLYIVFCNYYKNRKLFFHFALAILFLPSVVFWGSGILKDTLTFSGGCWFVYSIYSLFILKKSRLKYSIILLVSALLVVSIKPYIILALLPGTFTWILFENISKIKSKALRYFSIPLIYLVCIGGTFVVVSLFGSVMDKFSLDKIVDTAIVTQTDLKQDYYQGNSFDIGKIDPTAGGIISKAPSAITAGIYRPFLWEANNSVMLLSALENSFVLAVSLYLLIKIKFRRLLKIFFNNPLLLFSISYSILFAFSVGLTTSNFGALVRFKIPYISFFISGIFILLYFNRKENRHLLKIDQELSGQKKPQAVQQEYKPRKGAPALRQGRRVA